MILAAIGEVYSRKEASDDKSVLILREQKSIRYSGIIQLINGDAVKPAVINEVRDGKFIYKTTVTP